MAETQNPEHWEDKRRREEGGREGGRGGEGRGREWGRTGRVRERRQGKGVMRLTGRKEGVGVGGRERRHAGEKGGEEIERM